MYHIDLNIFNTNPRPTLFDRVGGGCYLVGVSPLRAGRFFSLEPLVFDAELAPGGFGEAQFDQVAGFGVIIVEFVGLDLKLPGLLHHPRFAG